MQFWSLVKPRVRYSVVFPEAPEEASRQDNEAVCGKEYKFFGDAEILHFISNLWIPVILGLVFPCNAILPASG